jgi:hypothetical protein
MYFTKIRIICGFFVRIIDFPVRIIDFPVRIIDLSDIFRYLRQGLLFHYVHEFFSEAHSLLSGTPEREGGACDFPSIGRSPLVPVALLQS